MSILTNNAGKPTVGFAYYCLKNPILLYLQIEI